MRQALRYQTPYHWAGAYLLMAVVVLLLDRRQTEVGAEEERTPGH
jgi:hypothetical protein